MVCFAQDESIENLRGMGRKQRSVPLRKLMVLAIRASLQLSQKLGDETALIPNHVGEAMKR